MKHRETENEKKEREAKDRLIMAQLIQQPDPHPRASNKSTYLLVDGPYSLHWILLYVHARNAGVSCMISSSVYADRALVIAKRGYNNYETHRITEQAVDIQLHWIAHQYWNGTLSPKAYAVA